jgi:hypothetical protein
MLSHPLSVGKQRKTQSGKRQQSAGLRAMRAAIVLDLARKYEGLRLDADAFRAFADDGLNRANVDTAVDDLIETGRVKLVQRNGRIEVHPVDQEGQS